MIADKACRFKVVGCLLKKFKSPVEAEQCLRFSVSTTGTEVSPTQYVCVGTQTQPEAQTVGVQTQSETKVVGVQTEGHGDSAAEFRDDFSFAVVSERFSKVALKELTLTVPSDFLLHSAKAMK